MTTYKKNDLVYYRYPKSQWPQGHKVKLVDKLVTYPESWWAICPINKSFSNCVIDFLDVDYTLVSRKLSTQ